MENKIGYAYISLEEYKELIKEKTELEIFIENLKKEVEDTKEMYRAMEEDLLKTIYDNCDWDLRNLEKNIDGEYDRKSYSYIEIEKEFQKHNISNLDYICKKIISMKKKKDNESKKRKRNRYGFKDIY
ncbi:MAG: hypothetical protein V8R01_01465 [Bacilli bacterium]